MSQPPTNQNQQREEEQKRHQEEERRKQQEEQQRQQREQGQQQDREPGQDAKPGDRLPNPAQPYADTVIQERPKAAAFLKAVGDAPQPSGYPKIKYHPVHGGVEVQDPGEEAGLVPKTDWFDTPELADAARTWTEAEQVRVQNQMAKLRELEEKDLPVVRNSVQSDESIRRAQVEPL